MTEIPDTLAELVTLLLADDGVTSAVGQDDDLGSYVFGAELPEALNGDSPPPAVVLTFAGGPGRLKRLKLRRVRVDTTCYGPTLEVANRVHRVVREALENAPRTQTLLGVETSSDGALARDRWTQWPTCYASYLVLAAIDP